MAEKEGDPGAYALDQDPWEAYYTQDMTPQAWLTFFIRTPTEPALNNHLRECDEIWHGKVKRPGPEIGRSREFHHPILIDTGAPGAVVGEKWLTRWAKGSNLALPNSSRSFRIGDGVGRPSLGACVLHSAISQVSPIRLKKSLSMC